MEGSGALKSYPLSFVQAGAAAEQHRVEHSAVVIAEPEGHRESTICLRGNVAENAPGRPASRREDSALPLCCSVRLQRGSEGRVFEDRDLRGPHTGMSAYALREKIVGVLPCSGIAVVLGDFQSHGSLYEVTALECWKSGRETW